MTPADLARLFATEAPRLSRRLKRFRGRVIAEDVVQAAFTRLLERPIDDVKAPEAYLASLTYRLAIDETRRQDRMPFSQIRDGVFEHTAACAATAEDRLIDAERIAHMTRAVLALPRKERLALVLFKLKGLSHADIGARLGVSRHSVPRYLARALAKCAAARQAFERAGLDEAGNDKRTAVSDRT